MCSVFLLGRHCSRRSSDPRKSHWRASKKLVLPLPFGPVRTTMDASSSILCVSRKPLKPSISAHRKVTGSDIIEVSLLSENGDVSLGAHALNTVHDQLSNQIRQ